MLDGIKMLVKKKDMALVRRNVKALTITGRYEQVNEMAGMAKPSGNRITVFLNCKILFKWGPNTVFCLFTSCLYWYYTYATLTYGNHHTTLSTLSTKGEGLWT